MQASNLIVVLSLATLVASAPSAQASYLIQQDSSLQQQAPVITPFAFNQNVQEFHRASVLCTVSSGDTHTLTISWLKDGQLLTPQIAAMKKIIIKPDSDQSTLKFAQVKLEHAGNYTCVAKNRAGLQSHSAQLIVFGEPRWLKELQHEPIIATRGQTIIIDCLTTGWPKPQQSWQIKTHQQSEFSNLEPSQSGRISLAANGSLIIRNADKSDEANYLCKSWNGIGKVISWSTSLKVNVPAHFKSNLQQSISVRKQNQVQLRCDAYGNEPITIEWYKNKQRLTNDLDSRYSIHNSPRQNELISLLIIKQAQRQDNSLYECVTRNQVGKDRLPIELNVQEEPDSIQELQTTQINTRSVTLMWTEPYDGRSSITSYMFQYKKVQPTSHDSLAVFMGQSSSMMSDFDLVPAQQQDSPSADLASSLSAKSSPADDWQQASRINMPVTPSGNNVTVRSLTIEKLDPSTKYVLRALATNAIGQSKFSQPMEFFTEEEAPEAGPVNIRASAINSTSILVSWDELPKSRQPVRIHGYYIGYRTASSTNINTSLVAQPNFIYKPYIVNELSAGHSQAAYATEQSSRLEYVIHDLRRDTNYEITVVAFNARGSSPSSDFVFCKTIEMEAPKPVKLSVRRESNDSIFIEWARDQSDQNPVDDYTLYQEKNSASQDTVWLQQRFPGNQTQYKAPGLKCGTRYQFYIIAHNKVGKSLPSEVISASTSGNLPVIPSKMNLIKMINSTCLLINLNSFQDNGCRIKTFTVRYRAEKIGLPKSSLNHSVSSNGLIGATHMALAASSHQAPKQANHVQTLAASSQHQPQQATSDWTTIRPEEDRLEYLCDLSPTGEYTIHVTATNDVGRSEIEYTVLMSSDELRYSFLRDVIEVVSGLPNVFAYIPSILVFLLSGLFVSLTGLILYTTISKYYQKFVIMHNQIRATRRAKHDEKRRRKLNNSRHSQKLDLWADEYDEDDDGDDEANGSNEILNQDDMEADGDDEEDEMTTIDNNSSCSSRSNHRSHHSRQHSNMAHSHNHLQFISNSSPNGHYLSNLGATNFDASSIDSGRCQKQFNNCHQMSATTSPDSIHGRFQCLNSKQYVKMNEYTMLPTISATLNSSPHNTGIYGTTANTTNINPPQASQPNPMSSSQDSSNNSLYYSTLRRSNMQTYLPQQRRSQSHLQHIQQHQHQNRRSQNIADIYGYYMAPPQLAGNGQAPPAQGNPQQVVANDEAANSIFVPPQQIIYSAPNIRRPPVFL